MSKDPGPVYPVAAPAVRTSFLAWHPNGRILAAAGTSKNVRLWDLSTGRWRTLMTPSPRSVLGLLWSPDGSALVAPRYFGEASVWSAPASGRDRVLREHKIQGTKPAFAPDGRLLWSGPEGTAVLDFGSGAVLDTRLDGNKDIGTRFAWNGARTLLAGGHDDATVRFWDGKRLRKSRSASGAPVTVLGWSPDDATLVTGDESGTIAMWYGRSGARKATNAAHRGAVLAIAFRRDAQFATTGRDGRIRLWSQATGASEGEIALPEASAVVEGLDMLRSSHPATMEFDPSGEFIALGYPWAIVVVRLRDGARLWNVGDAVFTEDGRVLAPSALLRYSSGPGYGTVSSEQPSAVSNQNPALVSEFFGWAP